MKKTHKSQEFLLSLNDFWKICLQKKKFLLSSCLLFSLAFGLFSLTRPIEFQAEASFREKNQQPGGLGQGGLGATFLVGAIMDESKNTSALTTLQSKELLNELIKQKSLQAEVTLIGGEDSLITRMIKNTKVLFAKYTKSLYPPLEDKKIALKINDLSYEGEKPLFLKVINSTKTTYQIETNEGKLVGKGEYGKPFYSNDVLFTLNSLETPSKETYQIIIYPIDLATDALEKKLTIEADKHDKTLIRFFYSNKDRHVAADVLNTYMDIYKSFLQRQNQRVVKAQISYLEERQEQMDQTIKKKMEDYASSVQRTLSSSGFPSTSHAMDFLAKSQIDCRNRLLKVSLDSERLTKILEEGPPFWDRFPGDLAEKDELAYLSEIRSLKQRSDSLVLALKKKREEKNVLDVAIPRQMNELARLRLALNETKEMADSVQRDLPTPELQELSKPVYLTNYWKENLEKKEKATREASKDQLLAAKQEEKLCKEQFLSYLAQLAHLLTVEEKALSEGISLADTPKSQYHGMSLESAVDLFNSHNKTLGDLEGQIATYDFLLNQINKADVDLSSLPSFVEDPISQSLCTNSLQMILAFRDLDNRSEKEKRSLDEALTLRKEFLAKHFEQSKELVLLRADLLRQNVTSLQDLALGLIQQRISLLDKHLADSCQLKLQKLDKEKLMLTKHQDKLLAEMIDLPSKWVLEKLIDQQLETNRRMVEEVAKLVESKNIAKNLDVIQSAPLDHATAPLKPSNPKFVVFLFLGAFLGGFMSLLFVLVQSIKKGVLASKENLRLHGFHAVGTLVDIPSGIESLSPRDLDLLRSQVAEHTKEKSLACQKMLILRSGKKSVAPLFASILAKQGKRVFLLPLSFQDEKTTTPCELLGYLEGLNDKPAILSEQFYDTFLEGGMSRFTTELLATEKFELLMKEIEQKYDWILGVSLASITSGEAKFLLSQFDDVVVQMNQETIEAILESTSQLEEKRVSFLFGP